jgi:hypothetical protein
MSLFDLVFGCWHKRPKAPQPAQEQHDQEKKKPA